MDRLDHRAGEKIDTKEDKDQCVQDDEDQDGLLRLPEHPIQRFEVYAYGNGAHQTPLHKQGGRYHQPLMGRPDHAPGASVKIKRPLLELECLG